MAQIKFVSISQEKYNLLPQKVASSIYFTNDTCRIYIGSQLYASDIEVITTSKCNEFLSQNGTQTGCIAQTSKLYIDSETGSMYVNISGVFTQIGISAQSKAKLAYLTSLTQDSANKIVTVSADGTKYIYANSIVNVISEQASDTNIPTEKAVRDILGGGADASNPILVNERINSKFNPIQILSTENKTGLEAVDVDGDKVPEYHPDNDYKKIQFIGDCKVTYRNDGQIVIRIGDNLNSSNFATKDGQTTGVENATVTVPTSKGSGTLSDGTSVTAVISGDYKIKTETAGNLIHFENNKDTSFEVVVNKGGVDKVYYFGPITGNGTYAAKLTNKEGSTVSGVNLVVTNFGQETKTAEGATGYCGSVQFTIAASAIADEEASKIKIVSVKHNNGGEGQFIDNALNANERYFYTDTTTVPTITSSSVTVTPGNSKTVSGVKYLLSATANYSVAFTNIANPVCVASNVVFDANIWAGDKTVSAAYNSTSATATGSVANGQHAQATNTVKVTVKNINGSSQQTATLENYSLLVDSNNTTDKDTVAYFDNEDFRLNSDLTAFVNTNSILTTSDLMQKNGKLIYPSGKYTGYNTILADGFTQPDYSTGLTTGKRTWYRKFYEAGDKNGATLTFVASSNIATTAFGSTLTVKIGKLDADGKVTGWYDATKKSTESSDGIATSVATNVLKVDWGAYGAAKNGIVIQLGMTSASHEIDTLTVAFA